MTQSEIEIWTDGSCLQNPGPGGWAAILKTKNKEYKISGAEKKTTNNRMELTALIQALQKAPKDAEIIVYSDSQYILNGISVWIKQWQKNNWIKKDKKPVLNQDLWQELQSLTKQLKIKWSWVKAHSGEIRNEACDKQARLEAQRIKSQNSETLR